MIEGTNATMAEATPVLEESPVLDETPVLEERPVQTDDPAPNQASVLEGTPVQTAAPMLDETPVLEEKSVQTDEPAPNEASVLEETPVQTAAPVLDETPVLEEKSVQTDEPAPNEASVLEETPVQTAAPVLDETPVAQETPVLEETTVQVEAPVLEETPEGDATPAQDALPAAQTESESTEEEEDKPVVRMLAVGQEVTGIVKRVSEFGAFIDIGVGRDGLVHISELSARRVAKVTDVLQQGQEVTFWIKKLDRDRNRISLTMIEPGTKTIRNMDKGDIVQGTVTRIMPYGAFVDIGIGRDALLHVREMGERFIAKPEDVVQVGELIDARILDISRRRARVDLSIKGLRPEPEPEPMPEPEKKAPAPQPEPEPADPFDDLEVLSPIEAALRKAMKESGTKLNLRKDSDRRPKKNESARARAMQEEIITRTLSSGKK